MDQPWYGYWRADRTPSKTLPLSVRSVGRANYPDGWRHGVGTIGWINLYWLIEGNFEVLTDGKKVVAHGKSTHVFAAVCTVALSVEHHVTPHQ